MSPVSSMNTVTSRDGTRIAYEKHGRGPALIIVLGALCDRNFASTPHLVEVLARISRSTTTTGVARVTVATRSRMLWNARSKILRQ